MRCLHCHCLLYEWKVNDDPWFEHAQRHPECTFIRQVEDEIFSDKVKIVLREIYNTEESRIETFKDWPSAANKTPPELVEAGFYYTGNYDYYAPYLFENC